MSIEIDFNIPFLDSFKPRNYEVKVSEKKDLEKILTSFKYNCSQLSNHFDQDKKEILLIRPGIGIFFINKKAIRYIRKSNMNDSEFARFILNTCMTYLLFLQKHLLIHGSAVEKDGKIYLFLGNSGSGKSTFAYSLCKYYGFKIVTEDVLTLNKKEDINILPSYPCIKLSKYLVDDVGFEVVSDGRFDRLNRHLYKIDESFFLEKSQKSCIQKIFFLENSNDNQVFKILPEESLKNFFSHTLRCIPNEISSFNEPEILSLTTHLINTTKQYKILHDGKTKLSNQKSILNTILG